MVEQQLAVENRYGTVNSTWNREERFTHPYGRVFIRLDDKDLKRRNLRMRNRVISWEAPYQPDVHFRDRDNRGTIENYRVGDLIDAIDEYLFRTPESA